MLYNIIMRCIGLKNNYYFATDFQTVQVYLIHTTLNINL